MGHKELEDLANSQDPTDVLHTISDTRQGFWALVNSSDLISIDTVIHILQVLHSVCTCICMSQQHLQYFNDIRGSKLLSQHIGRFFLSLCSQDHGNQCRMIGAVRLYLKICQSLLEKMPNCYEEILISLTCLHHVVSSLADDTELIDDEIRSQLAEVMKSCEENTGHMSQRTRVKNHLKTSSSADDLMPPNSIQDIDVFPTLDELIVVDKPFL